jgi:hypothetical protein
MNEATTDEATFIYCRPEVLETPGGTREVDEALTLVAAQLWSDADVQLRREGSYAATFSGVSHDNAWDAMDRALPLWKQRRLFFVPRP